MKLIDGNQIASQVFEGLKGQIAALKEQGRRNPALATVLLGEAPASVVYINHKRKKAHQIGVESFHHSLPHQTSEADLINLLQKLNQDDRIDGILVQLPLPAHIRTQNILSCISPYKDVDGFHPENLGLLAAGQPRFIPCTPKGCMLLLQKMQVELENCHAVVIGRSNIVGKPMALLLLSANATVTVCHRYTRDLNHFLRQADVVISATGIPHLIGAGSLKKGCVVIDVGISRNNKDNTLIGDVDTEAVLPVVRAITPVPGGVGPMTIAMLLENTLLAYQFHFGLLASS